MRESNTAELAKMVGLSIEETESILKKLESDQSHC